MITKIAKITVYVENQQDAKVFWTDKVGFVVVCENKMGDAMIWLEVAPSKEAVCSFVLYEKKWMMAQKTNASLEHPSIILSTNQIENTYELFKDKLIEVGDMMDMPYGKMFTFYDQDRNSYLVRQE